MLTVEPLTPTIGAVVHGVDLREVASNAELFSEIHGLWMEHLVLFFRDQKMTPDEHLALGECFGPLHIHPAAPFENGNPALMRIHADETSHRNNGEVWHSDVSADEKPPMASILRIHQVPKSGGDTLWANMYRVFDSFSDKMQYFLTGLRAEHRADYTGFYRDHEPQRSNPHCVHPVVRTHPVTKRNALFVNSGFTRNILGLTELESRSILKLLFERVRDPVFHCRFRWQKNSVAMWDNRCTQHMALWDYFPETRSGLRVTIVGAKPVLGSLR